MRGKSDEEHKEDIFVRSGMQYKICRNTYHMFYIIGTEDTFIRKRRVTVLGQRQRQSKWKAWLESEKGWVRDVEDKTKAEEEARKLLQ